jgi:VIT1/CCC1 family predicted Fe2+/Mn2+ transporter
MVVIINGYVALSNLNSGFVYIVVVNLGACTAWGTIDGLIYAISSSIERNQARNKLRQLKANVNNPAAIEIVCQSIEDTYLDGFDDEGKAAIAQQIIKHVPNAALEKGKVITREEALGWLSILAIYLVAGFLLALPFLVLQDKVLAWTISNVCGVAWLFWYGMQLGIAAGRNRWAFGFMMAAITVGFLAWSYLINA